MAALPTFAQINKGKKLFEQQEFEAALEAFKNDLERPINQPIALAGIARIHADSRYANKDVVQAYRFATRAIHAYQQLSNSDKKKVQTRGESQVSLSKLQSDFLQRGYQNALDAQSMPVYNDFLESFKTATGAQRKAITMKRDVLAYQQAQTANTYDAFKKLWENHGLSIELYNTKLYRQVQKDLLDCYVTENGWQLYPQFETLYPNNLYVRDSDKAYEFLNARRKHTIKAYQDFIRAYPRTPFVVFAQDGIYALTMKGEDLSNYDYFVRKYSDYNEIDSLWKRFYKLYVKQRGNASVLAFAKAYPNYPFQDQLEADKRQTQAELEHPLYERIVATEDVLLALDFFKRHPKSSYLPKLELPLYKALQKNPLLRGSRTFLKHYPRSSYYNAVLVLYYNELVKDGELSTLNQFMMEHPEYKDVERQQKDLVLAEQGAKLPLQHSMPTGSEISYETYIKAAAPKDRAFVALQRRLEPLILKNDNQAATEILKRLAPHFGPNDVRIQQLYQYLQPSPSNSTPVILSNDQMVLSDVEINETRLLFSNTATVQPAVLLQRRRQEQQWMDWQPVDGFESILEQNAHLNDISADGQLSLWQVTKANGIMDLHYAIKQGNVWSPLQALEPFGKSSNQQMDGYIAAGAKALLFASNHSNALLHPDASQEAFHGNREGNTDLFVLVRQERGQWSAPINLGDAINTPYEERHPVLHPDGKTLYFCSDGHGGLGRLDVYRCTRLDDTWTRWSTPENLGPNINSPYDDCPQGISLDHQRLYWTQRTPNAVLQTFSQSISTPTSSVALQMITCHVTNSRAVPTPATIVWQHEGTQGIPYHHRTPSGTALVPVDPTATYIYWAEQVGSWGPSIYHRWSISPELNVELSLYTVSDLLSSSILFFDEQANLSQQQAEVERLVRFLQQEKLRVLLPKQHPTKTGQLSAKEVETLLIALGCPKKYFSWYSPSKEIDGNTGLLVRFEAIPGN